MRRALLCAIATTVSAIAAAPLGAGCQTHQCDDSFAVFESGATIDSTTWETTQIDQPWIDFPGARDYELRFSQFANRRVVSIEPYVSFAREPNRNLDDFTLASGDIAELHEVGNGTVKVRNGTCADLFLRVVVRFAPATTSNP